MGEILAAKKGLPGSESEINQSKTRTFMRNMREKTGFLLKQPKLLVTATALALSLILLPVKNANSQEISAKTEFVSEKEPIENYRETQLKEGMLTIEGVGTFDVKDAMKLITNNEMVSEGQQKDKIRDIDLQGVGKGTYYIFETGIAGFFVNKDGKTISLRTAGTKGNDALFVNSIFLTDDGAIFATSSKTFIALTPISAYSSVYPDILKLEEPVFSAGTDKDKIDLRDKNTLGKEKLKLEFSYNTGKVRIVDDDAPPIGGADQ